MRPQEACDRDLDHGDQMFSVVDQISRRCLDDYAEAISVLGRAVHGCPDEEAKAAMLSVATLLRGHANIHHVLQASARARQTSVADHLEQVCRSISRARLIRWGVRLTLEVDDISMDPGRCWRLGLMVCELIINAARPHPDGSADTIWVAVAGGPRRLVCSVADNGFTDLGVRTARLRGGVEVLAAELGGAFNCSIESGGFRTLIDIPIAPGKSD